MSERSAISADSLAVMLSDVLATDELSHRHPRYSDFEIENRALRELARTMASEPHLLLQMVVDTALRMCEAGSAGISLLERAPEGDENFRWVALAGAYRAFVDGTTPADFSPCGVCLDCRAPQLFAYPSRYFTYLCGTEPEIVEGLYVPFPAGSQHDGVIWIATHREGHQFNREDVRLLSSLADFSAAAMQTLSTTNENTRLHTRIHNEIRERHRAENAFYQTGETLRTLIYSSPMPIVVVDPDPPLVQLWNPEAERLFGWREREVLGRTIPNIPHEKLPETSAYRYATAQGKTFHDMETYRLRKDGSRVEVNILAAPLYDHDSLISGILLLFTDETERKQSAEALRESEERLAVALTAAGMGAWRADLKSRTYHRDGNCNRILGRGEIVTQQAIADCFTHIHRDDRERLQQAFQTAITHHGPYEVDVRFVRPDGSVGWIREMGRPVGNTADGPEYVTGVMLDITSRKEDEERLWASELSYRLVVQSSSDAIWDWDLASNQVMWNEGLQSRFGYSAEQTGPKVDWWIQHLHDEDRQRVIEGIHLAIENGAETWQDEYRFQRADGSFAHVFDSGHLVHNDHTKAFRMVGFMMDLTERKRTEQLIRNSEQIYRAIGESIDYGVWLCDAEGRNIYTSESMLKLVGLSQGDCTDFGWVSALHPEDAERTIAAWRDCVRRGGTWDMEHRVKGTDGAWHPVLARGVPVRNDVGEIVSWVGINLDIGRLKQAELALKEADRRKDEFLATLAHELRNPLAPIRNAIEYIQLKGPADQELSWAHDVVARQINQMTRLIDDLLDVSRISRNKLELKIERVVLGAIIQAAVETSRPVIEQSAQELIVELPAEPMHVEADLNRLAQVFLNLLNNASKYSEKHSPITIKAEQRGHEAVVTVRDRGVGIAADMLPKIFEMFTQVEESLERSQGGLGIGLTLVKRLVEMHGGRVRAASPGPQQGSEFTVYLPICQPPEPSALNPQAERNSSISNATLKILVVDDNQDSALSMAMMLQILNHTTQVAYDGEEAVAAAAQFRPDLILLDIGLPKLNGYEACKRIRQQPGGTHIAIIALTGWGQAEDKRLSADAGFDQHLVKPIDPNLLMQLLQDVALRGRQEATPSA